MTGKEGDGGGPDGSATSGTGDGPAELVLKTDEQQEVERKVHARARHIAARLSMPKPRADRTARRGSGRYASLPYRDSGDDLDLDRTLEILAERAVPEDEDLIVRERVRPPRSVVLLVDVSGSMRGERVHTAAAAVGALAGELERDKLSVIAFWSDAALLLRLGDPVRPQQLLDRLLRIPAQGLTNIAFPLQLAAQQLRRAPARDSRVVLLSDCVHVAGPDPRPFAAKLPRLDVLLDTTSAKDIPLGKSLARAGHGAFRTVRRYGDVAAALTDIFRSE